MTPTQRANDFVRDYERHAQPLEQEQAHAMWDLATAQGGTPEAVATSAHALRKFQSDPAKYRIVKELLAQKPDIPSTTVREMEVIYPHIAAYQMSPDSLEKLSHLESKTDDVFNCFRPEVEGESLTNNDIHHILGTDPDTSFRKKVWEASKQVGEQAGPIILQLVELRNKEARRKGFRDYVELSMTLQDMNESHILGLLDDLEKQTRQPFLELKARIDRSQRQRFSMKESEVLYPWHYVDPFFQERPSTDHDFPLNALFSEFNQLDIIPPFFEALGLKVSDILQNSDLDERPGKNQHAFCMRLDRKGDTRILVNLRPGEAWSSTLLHELGHAVYDKNLPMSLSWVARDVAHPLTTEGIALFMERMTKNPAWLQRYLGIEGKTLAWAEKEVPKVLQEDRLIFTRWSLLMIHFERAMYQNPDRDLATVWWDLAQKYQMITPPKGREGSFDWAAKIHLASAPVYYQNYPLGDLVASHLHHHLIHTVLKDEKDPAKALISSPKVGRFLMDRFFALGATLHWEDHIQEATGESLNPGHHAALLRGERF